MTNLFVLDFDQDIFKMLMSISDSVTSITEGVISITVVFLIESNHWNDSLFKIIVFVVSQTFPLKCLVMFLPKTYKLRLIIIYSVSPISFSISCNIHNASYLHNFSNKPIFRSQLFGVYTPSKGCYRHTRQMTDSLLCIHQWCRSCCWWVSDPPLRRRHHSVYFCPFFGHCVNNPPGKLQCHTTLLPWPPIALKYK
jgi:hypothetical protein